MESLIHDTPDSEGVPSNDRPTDPIESFTTGGHCHYWTDGGIQPTGERLVKCRDCPLGMERDPSVYVIDGKMRVALD